MTPKHLDGEGTKKRVIDKLLEVRRNGHWPVAIYAGNCEVNALRMLGPGRVALSSQAGVALTFDGVPVYHVLDIEHLEVMPGKRP